MEPSDELATLCREAVRTTFAFHGTAAGSISSDEYVGGLSPQRGSELCCSVELMFSLSYLYQLFGDNNFADLLDLAAFNAVPAGISADWWSHQYITQINQPWACEFELPEGEKTPFYDVCRYANVFGLEPEFVSFLLFEWSRIKIVNTTSAMLHRQPPNGLSETFDGHLSLEEQRWRGSFHPPRLPSSLEAGNRRNHYQLRVQLPYPFAPCALNYSITTNKKFEFLLRVPPWASTFSTIELKDLGSSSTSIAHPFNPNTEAQSDSLYSVKIPGAGSFEIFVTINAEVRVKQHENNSISFYYGSLLYGFEIDFDTKTRPPRNYKGQASDGAEIAQLGDRSGEPWMERTRDHDYLPKSDWNIAVDQTKEVKVVVNKKPWSDNVGG